jgi:RelB Antitoxin alpha helical domain
MGELKKKYTVDEENRRIAVQIDIKDFEEIEEVLENYALAQLIKENREDDTLDGNQAKTYYETLERPD